MKKWEGEGEVFPLPRFCSKEGEEKEGYKIEGSCGHGHKRENKSEKEKRGVW
jgi:hypothetical protein